MERRHPRASNSLKRSLPRKHVSSIRCPVTSSASRLVLLNWPPPHHLWIGTKSRHVLLPQRVTKARAGILLRRVQLVTLSARDRIPTAYSTRDCVEVGGLMSCGNNITDSFSQAGVYAGKILNGAKPAELPVIQSTKFEFVINLQTAKALGLDVPSGLLLAGDEVIE